ncbi:penicillin acylase family protein [Tistrella bauzanensis]|uniref:penicillin acylase family protein n=1 Tax=Tistrella TaxID=171436 RepID=UPI0031F6CBC4
MRWIGRILGGLIFLIVAAVVIGGLWLRTSLPETEGRITLDGLKGEVTVIRDAEHIPHIKAGSIEDALFALGYLHAQDRLWQMEFQRRAGSGRLSEIAGASTIGIDRFIRTTGVYQHAARTYDRLDAETRGRLDAYVAGINAQIAGHDGAWPLEFVLTGITPSPWTPADSLVWLKMMAWDLAKNWRDELLRARMIAAGITVEQIADLWPDYVEGGNVALPEIADIGGLDALADVYRDTSFASLLDDGAAPPIDGIGSNNWVISGAHTRSGKPLLANDPHLGLAAPSLWYLAHLSAPGLEVIGASLPGLPTIMLGRTNNFAWGFTNTGPDTQDFVIERLTAPGADTYETPSGPMAFTTRTETITVKGADPVQLTIRESRNGPIMTDVAKGGSDLADRRHVLAFRWVALTDDDPTLQAAFAANTATDFASFREGLRNFYWPQQNIVFADTSGRIAYLAPARVPIRANGDGFLPTRGWTDEGAWTGWIPYDDLPQLTDPEDGRIVTANQRITPDGYPYFISREWTPPYRADRIEEMLDATPAHDIASFQAMMGDTASLMARDFMPLMLAGLRDARSDHALAGDAAQMLKRWDGDMAADATAPLVFSAWYRALLPRVAADELGDLYGDYSGHRTEFLMRALTDRPVWCDDTKTPETETCAVQIARALDDGLAALVRVYGDDMAVWRWGEAHPAVSENRVLAAVPVLKDVFAIAEPIGGDTFTVNAQRWSASDPEGPAMFNSTHGPGYRAIYDLADLNRSVFIQSTGQSGNPLAGSYDGFADRWAATAFVPMITDWSVIEAADGSQRLTLTPGG